MRCDAEPYDLSAWPVRIAIRADAHVAVIDVPAFVGSIGRAAAGEGGHGLHQALPERIGNCG
jgi:hypothetical protein